MRRLIITLTACGLMAACGSSKDQTSPTAAPAEAAPLPAADRPAADDEQTPTQPGVKPHHVECDPARPDMPCTPDTGPIGAPEPAKRGVKPHYVKCDPARPDMPCTPELAPIDIEGAAPKTE